MNTQEIQNKVEQIERVLKDDGYFELSPGVHIITSANYWADMQHVYDGTEYPFTPDDEEFEDKEFQLFEDLKNGVCEYWLSTDNGINQGYHRIIDIITSND